MPNAGLPQRLEGRFVYAAGADYFADVTPGCWMPAPASSAVAAVRPRPTSRRCAQSSTPGPEPGPAVPVVAIPAAGAPPQPRSAAIEPVAAATAVGDAPLPTRLAGAVAEGRFVVSVEIDPPRSVRIDRTIEAARLLQAAGVDTVNISDSAMARVRMGAMAVAFGIQHDLDLECVVHLTTRDRNLMALESELLGAHALGVRNILALTGDPPRVGDYPTGTGVWDVDSDRPRGGALAPEPRRGPGRLADRPARQASRSPVPLTRRPPTRRRSGIAWSASSPRAPTSS